MGPYRSDAAPGVVKGEIWETITRYGLRLILVWRFSIFAFRRGIMGNLMMGVIPMAFYATLNLVAWILENIVNLFGIHY